MAEQLQPPAPAEAKTALEGALEIKKGIIRVDEKTVLNAREWRNGTLLTKEGRKTSTNLVDYLKEDSQIVTMLKEAARLGILKEHDLAQMGIGHKIYLSGEKADLKLYPLDHQQKAEALAFLLEKFSGGTLPKAQRELYFKRVFNEVVLKGVHHVDNEGGPLPIFSPRDVINCLIIAGHEENAEYLLQQGYRPSDRFEIKDKSRRQVAAEVSTTPQPNYTRELEGKMKAVAKRGERLNIPHTVDVDLRVAQAMFNVFLPAPDQIAMAKIQMEIDKTADPTQKENLRQQLVDKRREAYAAILNAFETEGYQIGGKYLQEISQRSAQDRVIDRAREMNKDDGAVKRFKDKSIFEANRESLTLFASEILGVKEDKVRNAISKLDWSENKFEQLKNQLRQPGFSESHLNDLVYKRLFDEFYDAVKPSSQRKNQPTKEDKTFLKLMFKETYLTERALRDRFKAVENPYDITLSEMQDWGIKGLDLLFRRTLPGYHEVEPYEDYVQRLRDRLKELAEQPPAPPTPPAPRGPAPPTAAPTPAEVTEAPKVTVAPPAAEAVYPLNQAEQQLQAWGLKPDQYVLEVHDRIENQGTPQEKKVTVYTLNQLTLPATEDNARALSQLGEALKNQGVSFEIGNLTLNIPKDKAAAAIDLGNCQLKTLKIDGEPAGKINIQNAKSATIELGNNLTARLEPADLEKTPIETIRLFAASTLTIDQKHLPALEKAGTRIYLGRDAKILVEIPGEIPDRLTGEPGEYRIGKDEHGAFILQKAKAVVEPAETPKPPSPPPIPQSPPSTPTPPAAAPSVAPAPQVPKAPAYTVVPPQPSTTVEPPPITPPAPKPPPAEPTVAEATVSAPQEQLSEAEQLALRQYFYLNELVLAVDKGEIPLKVKTLEMAGGISKTSSQLKDKKPEELGTLRQTVAAADQNKKFDSVASLYYLLTENVSRQQETQIRAVLKQVSPDLLKDKNMNFALANAVLHYGTPSQKKIVTGQLQKYFGIDYKVVPPRPSTTVEPPPVIPPSPPPSAEPTVVETTVVPAAVEALPTVTVPLESLIKERNALAQKYGNIPAFLISNPDDQARLQQLESAISAQQAAEKPVQEKSPKVLDFLKSRQTATSVFEPSIPAEEPHEAPPSTEAVVPEAVGEKLGLTEEQKNNLANSLPLIQRSHHLSNEDMTKIMDQISSQAELIKNARPLTEETLPPRPTEGKGFGRLKIGREKDFEAKTQMRKTAEKELNEYNFVRDLLEPLNLKKSPEERNILAAQFYRILQTMFSSFPADQSQLIQLLLQEEHKEKQAAVLEILQLI